MTICRTLYLPDNINTLHWYKFATHVLSFTVAIHLLIWPFAMSSEKQWKLNMTKKPFWTFRKSKDQISLLPLDDRLYWKDDQWAMDFDDRAITKAKCRKTKQNVTAIPWPGNWQWATGWSGLDSYLIYIWSMTRFLKRFLLSINFHIRPCCRNLAVCRARPGNGTLWLRRCSQLLTVFKSSRKPCVLGGTVTREEYHFLCALST